MGAFFLAVSSLGGSAELPYVLSEPVVWHLTYGEEFSNSHTEGIRGTVLEVPVITDHPPYLFVSDLRISPEKHRIYRDRWGNRIARFEFPLIKPGEKITIAISCKVRNFQVIYPVDFEKLKSGVPGHTGQQVASRVLMIRP